MLRIVTRKEIKAKLAEKKMVDRLIITKSAIEPTGLWYHNRVESLHYEIVELERRYEFALKWGVQIINE